jgi:hypothetical protein
MMSSSDLNIFSMREEGPVLLPLDYSHILITVRGFSLTKGSAKWQDIPRNLFKIFIHMKMV